VRRMRVPCHVARRIARRWSESADAGTPAEARAGWTARPRAAVRPDGRAMRRRGKRRRGTSPSSGANPERAPAPTAPHRRSRLQSGAPAGDGDESAEAHDA
jgi:hypothetical protein